MTVDDLRNASALLAALNTIKPNGESYALTLVGGNLPDAVKQEMMEAAEAYICDELRRLGVTL